MAEMDYISTLSHELLDRILGERILDFKDICAVTKTCKNLRDFCQSDSLWRHKFKFRWRNLYPKLIKKKNSFGNWKKYCAKGHCILRDTFVIIESMSRRYYKEESDISDDVFEKLFSSFMADEIDLLFCIHQLRNINIGFNGFVDLTMKYYGDRAHLFLKHHLLKQNWSDYFNTYKCTSSIPALERGALLISHWFDPYCSYDICDIDTKLNEIAMMVQTELVLRSKDHPAGFSPLVKIDDELLTVSKWKPNECRILFEALNHVLYKKLGFHGVIGDNEEQYFVPQNSFIHSVLESKAGIPITLCIIYAAIAYRLGVICLCVNCPAHFMLKFIEHPELNTEEAFTYIDPFNLGKLTNRTQMGSYHPRRNSPSRTPLIISKVMERMCRNLINAGRQEGNNIHGVNYTLKNALELMVVICPDDHENKMFLARLYLHLDINLKLALMLMDDVMKKDSASTGIIRYMADYAQNQIHVNESKDKKMVINPRNESCMADVLFKVGNVARHVRYNYNCVIYGWDPVCMASKDWIKQMHVHLLPKKELQPFYHVLVEDGSNRYAAQENLVILDEAVEITHWAVGKYFCKFDPSYGYQPNNELLYEYPHDVQ